jgi:hypothetical protein
MSLLLLIRLFMVLVLLMGIRMISLVLWWRVSLPAWQLE